MPYLPATCPECNEPAPLHADTCPSDANQWRMEAKRHREGEYAAHSNAQALLELNEKLRAEVSRLRAVITEIGQYKWGGEGSLGETCAKALDRDNGR